MYSFGEKEIIGCLKGRIAEWLLEVGKWVRVVVNKKVLVGWENEKYYLVIENCVLIWKFERNTSTKGNKCWNYLGEGWDSKIIMVEHLILFN